MQLGRYLVLAYLVLMPWSDLAVPWVSGHDYARIMQVALTLACAGCLLLMRDMASPMPSSRAGRALAGLMVLQTVISVSLSVEPLWALREVGLALGGVAIALTVASAPSRRALHTDAVAVVVAGAFYGALVLTMAALSLLNHWPLLWGEFSPGYNHPRFFNHVQTVALPLLAIVAGCAPRRSLLQVAAWFGLTAGFALLWFTGGRATLLALVVAPIAGLVLLRSRARTPVVCLVTGMALGLGLYLALFIAAPALLGLPVPFELANRAQDSNSVSTRLFLWSVVANQVQRWPLWGEGPMHFAHHQNFDAAHPHNIYLQLAGEWGLPMLAMVLLAAGWGFRRLWVAVREECDLAQANVGSGLWMTGIAVACDGLLSGNLVMPVSQVWIAALVGWAIAWVRLGDMPAAKQSAPHGLPLGAAMAAGLLASQLALAASIWPQVTDLTRYLDEAAVRFPSAHLNPRFWSHGWF